ncbi:MAG: Xaa-Pro peptidase family protein [Chloroflexota bacterium]|jgi:Xaa-Pro aminopeptidase
MTFLDAKLIRDKVSQAGDILRELDVDLWLTFVRETSMLPDPVLDLILGLDLTWRSVLLISKTGHHTVIAGHFDAENIRRLDVYDEVIDYHQSLKEPLVSSLEKYDPSRIAINFSKHDVSADGLTLGNYRMLQAYLEGTPYGPRLESAERIIHALRGRKTETEVERVRQAIASTERLFSEVESFVRPGMSQRQIASFVHQRIDDTGLNYAWDKAYNPIVTCGPNSSIGHAIPGDVPLERGHTLHLDLGVRQIGYCSDLQRTWYVLAEGEEEAPADVRQAFDAVLAALKAGETALKVGTSGWQVDAAARRTIVEAGYPEYMHAFGHLLGQSAHDGATVLAPQWERYAGINELPVEPGNIFALELHVFVPNRGIVSLEEDVLVTENEVLYLSSPQRSLRFIRG